MQKRIGVVHAIFECQDCGKTFSYYKNAQALAAKHAKKYKHRVQGELGLSVLYDGKKENGD